MDSTLVMDLAMAAVMAFMIFRMFTMWKKTRKNQRLLKVLDLIEKKEEFFQAADTLISTDKDKELAAKVSVIRLWGDVYYGRDEEFREHLAELNLQNLVNPDGKNKGFTDNEDSFFYLYLAIENRLYSQGKTELMQLLRDKMEEVRETNSRTLLLALNEDNRKFYEGTGDRGKEGIRKLLNGEYGGYVYSKSLIGLYKNCEEVILARIYKDEEDTENYNKCLDDLKGFDQTRLGARWLKELNISLPDDSAEEEPAEEEKDPVQDAEVKEETMETSESKENKKE